ncbi:MAG: DUF4097 family beta strand repeat-containing protein [Armatimonadota bacterium]
MKFRITVALSAIFALWMLSGVVCAPQRTLLDEIGLPLLPGSKIIMEANIPPGKLMDSIAREYGSWLGLSELKQVGIITLSLDQNIPVQQVLRFYEPSIAEPTWKTIAKSLDNGSAMAIVYNDKRGMLVINIDPVGKNDRQLTIVRVLGKLDPSKIARSERSLPDRIRQWISGPFGPAGESGLPETVARIPGGKPISIPPAKWLQIKTLRSNIKVNAKSQNTVTIFVKDKDNDYGELVRTNTGLVIATSPQLLVDSIQLPSSIPIILQITEGSLVYGGGFNPNDRPANLDIIATSAPVIIDGFPLISGIHTIKSVGGDVEISLSQVTAGKMEVEVTGNDIILTLPADTSAQIEAAVTSGKVQNLTGVKPIKSGSDFVNLKMGDGKAAISIQAVNGTISIKLAR